MHSTASRGAPRIQPGLVPAFLVVAALVACGSSGGDDAAPAAAGPPAPAPAAPAGGQPSAEGPGSALQRADFRVNQTAEGRQQGARLVRLSGGGFVAAWGHPSATGPGEVRMQRFDARMQPLGGETLVSASGIAPGVAALAAPDGGFVVTWTDLRQGVDESGHLQVFGSDGTPRGPERSSDLAPSGYVARPVGLRDGNAVLAADALTGRQGTDEGTLQVLTPDGAPVNQPVVVNDDPVDTLTHVLGIVASPREGGFAAAWAVSSPTGSRIVLGLFNAAGNPVAAFVTVDAGAAEKRFPSLATLRDGSFVLAWAAFEAGTQSLVLQRLDAGGRLLGRQAVPTGAVDRPFEPRVAALDDGGFVVASATTTDAGAGQNQRTVSAQRFDAAGIAAGAAETVAQFTVPSLALGAAESLDIAAAGGSQYVLVYGSHSAATDWDVRAAVR